MIVNTATQQQGNFIHTTIRFSQGRGGLAATSSGELVFFGGGAVSFTKTSDRVDIYNVTSGNWTTATLSIPRASLAATSSQNLVFFGGGTNSLTVEIVYTAVDIYNISDGSWKTANLSQGRYGLAVVSIADLVIFAGGGNTTEQGFDIVDIYNLTSDSWTTTTLSHPRYFLAGAAVDDIALFGGGYGQPNVSNLVDIFNVTSGVWNTSTLSVARYNLVATSLGHLAFFAGGNTSYGQALNVVDIFNATSQTWTNTTLSQARVWLAAAAIGEIVAFGGGTPDGFVPSSAVDMYNVTNNTWFTTTLSEGRGFISATSSKNKIFFGGGLGSTGLSNVVDVFDFNPPSLSFPPSPFPPLSSNVSVVTTTQTSFQNSTNETKQSSEFDSNSLPSEVIAQIVVAVGVFLIGAGVGIFVVFLLEKRAKKKTELKSTYTEINRIQVDNSPKIQKDTPIEELTRSQSGIRRSQISFNELVVDKEIGEGSYGKVCLGKWNDAPVALKFCRKKSDIDDFMSEVRIMLQLPPHPNVIQMFGISLDGPQLVLILEYCAGGSLDKLLYSSGQTLSDERKLELIRGIARGVLHLHKHNIVHRDLAARNILLTSGGEPKISDFGMSRILEKAEEGRTKSEVGPVCWMAPESIAHRNYSKKSDVWTFGIVVYEIVAQCEPHKEVHNLLDVAVAIRDQGLTPKIPENCPPLLRELMEMCWKKVPEERPTIETICSMLTPPK